MFQETISIGSAVGLLIYAVLIFLIGYYTGKMRTRNRARTNYTDNNENHPS